MRRPVLAAALAAALVAGCAGEGTAPRVGEPRVDLADGFYLELWILGADNYATLYRVNGRRQLGFGGGRDAFNRNINWVGELGEAQYDRLQALLERHGWFEGSVESSGEPPRRVARIRLQWPGGHRRFKVTGDSEDVEPVRRMLDDAARQRLRRDLDRLPRAGEQRYK